jgi:hypothetical protein
MRKSAIRVHDYRAKGADARNDGVAKQRGDIPCGCRA